MPVLGRGYKKEAKTELERAIRKIEEESKKAKTQEAAWKQANAMQAAAANIVFAQQIQLITAEQANDYKDRIRKAAEGFQREHEGDVARTEYGENDRGMTAAEWRRELVRKREQEQENQQNQQSRSAGEKTSEEPERTK